MRVSKGLKIYQVKNIHTTQKVLQSVRLVENSKTDVLEYQMCFVRNISLVHYVKMEVQTVRNTALKRLLSPQSINVSSTKHFIISSADREKAFGPP